MQIVEIWPNETPEPVAACLQTILDDGVSLANKPKLWATYSSMLYVLKNGIEGDFVEIGCWNGGHMIAAGLAELLLKDDDPYVKRTYHGYDTFDSGFLEVKRESFDVPTTTRDALFGKVHDEQWSDVNSVMLPTTANEARTLSLCQGYCPDIAFQVHCKDVERMSADEVNPKKISVLRLDSDFYHSTYDSLKLFYPALQTGGVILLDDYGHWEGCRRGVDDFFKDSMEKTPLWFVTNTGARAGIKI